MGRSLPESLWSDLHAHALQNSDFRWGDKSIYAVSIPSFEAIHLLKKLENFYMKLDKNYLFLGKKYNATI